MLCKTENAEKSVTFYESLCSLARRVYSHVTTDT